MAFLVGGANTSAVTAYNIENSCRFNNDDSASMSITPGSSGNPDKWTFSCWFKRGNLAIWGVIFAAGDGADNRTEISLEADPVDVLRIFQKDGGSTTLHLKTNRKFRDCSAWYHLCLAVDTGQGTDANKFKIYINGVLETSLGTATYFSDDTNTLMSDSSYPMYVGRAAYGATGYWDGYLADCVFINDAQLAVSNFGETDSDSGIWKPIDVSGLTAGTNGFYLDFKDSSNLGNDAFGGTDLTESNLAATDQCTDTPTNNFCTLNPLSAGSDMRDNGSFKEGNCELTNGDTTGQSNGQKCSGTIGFANGKWYWEVKLISNTMTAGIVDSAISTTSDINLGSKNFVSFDSETGAINNIDGAVQGETVDSQYDDGDIIGIAVDADNQAAYFAINNAYQNSGNPTSGASKTGGATFTAGNQMLPLAADNSSASAGNHQYNFGNAPFSISSGNADANGYGNFEYAPPSGFYALCTKNLAEFG